MEDSIMGKRAHQRPFSTQPTLERTLPKEATENALPRSEARAVTVEASAHKRRSSEGTATTSHASDDNNEPYMNSERLEHFRNILLARRNELIDEADRTAGYIQNDSKTYADAIDQAAQEEEFALQLKERDRERKLLQKIDVALLKIERRKYGFCTSCGAEIGIKRLEARPTTNQCIDCKKLEEIKER